MLLIAVARLLLCTALTGCLPPDAAAEGLTKGFLLPPRCECRSPQVLLQANQELTKRCLLLDVENERAKSAHAALLADRRGLEAELADADAAVRAFRDEAAAAAREAADQAAALASAEGGLRQAQERLRGMAAEVRAAEEAATAARMEAERVAQELAAARAKARLEAEARERAARVAADEGEVGCTICC
jgi:hypothetical protein